MAERRAKSACSVRLVKASRPSTAGPRSAHSHSWQKPKTSLPRSPPPRPSNDRRRGDGGGHARAMASTRSTRCQACRTTCCSRLCSRRGDRVRTVHTRHEQGAAYMALGAALATGKPAAYAVVPGRACSIPSAALLTAYSMNAPVLALIGEIPDADIGRHLGQLHEIRDQAGIINAAGGLFRADPQGRAGAASGRRGDARDGDRAGPARPRCNARSTSGASPDRSKPQQPPAAAAAQARRDRDPQGREASGRRKKSDDRLRRRRARRRRGSDGACPPCCRRRCWAIAAAAACSTAAIR